MAARALSACGGTPVDGTGKGGDPVFIAFTADFASFRSWQAFPLPASVEQGAVHLPGPKTDYLNELPPTGSREFPVGTIIVKEIEVGPFEARQVFAMVKRGGRYGQARA